ncbi:ABC-2 family transporter protein-domain-containing protein, partial [Ochromonadaceae sp. CCMP2298]
MQGRFNGDPEEGVYGVAVEVEVGVGAGGAGGVEGAVVEDEFGGCAQGADVLYDMSQYAILSADDPPQQEKGSSRYGVVTIARTTNASQLHYNVLLNASAVHAVGVYVNLVHQAFLQVLSVPTAKITTHSYPLPTTYREKNEAASASAFVTALFTLIAFCFIPAQMAVFVVREREVKAKHQQVISGVSIYAYWISTYLWDVLAYLPTAALVLLVLYIFDVKSFITGDAATATTGLLLLYGPATAALTYALSFLFVSHSTAQIAIMFFHFVTGLILSVVSFVLTSITSTAPAALSLRYLFRVFPSFCLGDGILLLALCVDDQCPQITSQGFGYEVTLKPLDWDIAGADMAFMGIHAVFYFALTVGIEYCLTFPSLLMWLYAVEEEEEEEGGEGGEGALLLDAGAGVGTGAVGAKEGVEGAEAGEDEDVLAERVRVLSGAADSEGGGIQQLRKVYPANSRAGGARGGVCFAALGRGLWRNICGAAG